MANSSGVDDQILTLPTGGGAVAALGSTFETDLNTGTGGYEIPITLPTGPNGIRPSISLRYHSAAANGAFGMGWTVGLMTICRQTDGSLPTYTSGDDNYVLAGDQPLIDIGGGEYRPKIDTHFWRILRQGDGWEVTDTRGTRYLLGVTAGGRVETVESGLQKTAMWLLEQMIDTNGNTVAYTYIADGAQRYLSTIAWGTYQLAFSYESRPDVLNYGRFGFLLETKLRCNLIELNVTSTNPPLIRSWILEYDTSAGTSLSLLKQVTLRGHAADGTTLDAPPMVMTYTTFRPRELERVKGPLPGALPGSFANGTVETIDWNGDALPDVIELDGTGGMRIWPNRGRNRLGVPLPKTKGPALLSFDQPAVTFADMDGNGTADLIVFNRALGSYYPLKELGGFGQEVYWNQAPGARLAEGDARLMDLNGDGIIDLLVTAPDFYSLYYRQTDNGWSTRPTTIPRSEAPPVSLSDPRVFLADMTGDGLQDLVRVDGGGITYWQYLGNGTWTSPVSMQNPPMLPSDFDPDRLYLTDIDGDGCADVVYVDAMSVSYWFNQSGNSISEERTISFTPFGQPGQIRLVDLNGTGTAGILWSTVPVGSQFAWFYLDIMGATKPYLLESISNGAGLMTTIEYRPSTEFALDDADSGSPWRTFHPFAMQCVSQVIASDAITGATSTAAYHYHEGRYDGILKTFAGFGAVDVDQIGDGSISTMRTHNVYHVGLDPADPQRVLSLDERNQLAALQGRLLRSEVYGLDGSPQANKPYAIVNNDYAVDVVVAANGGTVYVPRPTRTLSEQWERGDAAFSSTEKTYLNIDRYGNILQQHLRAWRTGNATDDQNVTTTTSFAINLTQHIVSLPARVTQTDANGTVISSNRTLYDGPSHVGLAEGQADVGNITRFEMLAISDDQALSVYAAQQPDWIGLGYFRHPGENGWWICKVSYERLTTASGFSLISRGPRGFDTRIDYDTTLQYPQQLTDAAGNAITGQIDQRAMQTSLLTDANGATSSDAFDALGRVVAAIKPGDTQVLPTTTMSYQSATSPVSTTVCSRLNSGAPATFDCLQYYDARGRSILSVTPGEGDSGRLFIMQGAQTYNARGLVQAAFEPYYSETADWSAPPTGTRQSQIWYDGLARIIRQTAPSGATVIKNFAPGSVETHNQPTTPGASPKRVVQYFDALNRVIRVEYPLPDRTIAATYQYDTQNHIVSAVDPGGGVTTMTYNLLGKMLMETSVDSGKTLFVVDAAGNLCLRTAADGKTVRYEVDSLDRVVSVTEDGATSPEVSYTYLDANSAQPADGWLNRRGRLYQINDRLGTLVYAYDARGNTVQSNRTVTTLARSFVTDVEYDAFARASSVTLPEASTGEGRRVINYQFNARALLDNAPSYVQKVNYDVDGNVTSLLYPNGVEEATTYDPLTRRPITRQITGPGNAVLSNQSFTFDETGNLQTVVSPNASEAATFQFDALDRLIQGSYGSGENYTYAYADNGNITSNTELGAFAYAGAPGSGAATSAGANIYSYDAAGRMQTGASGSFQFNGLDQLVHVSSTTGSAIDYTYDFTGGRVARSVNGSPTEIIADTYVEIHNAKAVLWIPFGGRKILALTEGTGVYVHTDILGTPTLFTDLSGNLVRQLGFAPYGKLRFDTAPGAGLDDGARYGGYMLDADTGLISMGSRYYDPQLGRFISPDHLIPGVFLLDSWNRYLYAHNNPLRYKDPSGQSSTLAIIAIGVLVGLVMSMVTFGVAGAFAAALSVTISDATIATVTVGEVTGSVLAGLSADRAGGNMGNVLLGMVVGALIGGATAYLGGAVSANILSSAGRSTLGFVLAGISNGQICGAGSGVAIGFAGGKGSLHSIYAHLTEGVMWGTIIGGMLGYAASFFSDKPWMQVLTLRKVNLATADDAIDMADRPMGLGIDAGQTALSHNPANMVSDVLDFRTAADVKNLTYIWQSGQLFNGAVINIDMSWVPRILMSTGGISAVTSTSIGLDDFGVFSYADQISLALGAVPIIGWFPTLLDIANLSAWNDIKSETNHLFSMGDSTSST